MRDAFNEFLDPVSWVRFLLAAQNVGEDFVPQLRCVGLDLRFHVNSGVDIIPVRLVSFPADDNCADTNCN